MIITSAQFITSAVKPSQYTLAEFPEIAFAGRSNVGKSSLINALVNRRRLVKTSRTPGRTQLINFFLINDSLSFVDLPGYGYAKVPAAVKKKWGPMIETYLSSRESLKGVILILDIRRSPGMEELNFIDWLGREGLACLMVLTKTDKLSKTRQAKQHHMIARAVQKEKKDLLLFSAKTKKGKAEIWRAIEQLIDGDTHA
ncbi:MAG: YihA family ribosome biogenesis GTP-binding protein [Deltaproteobacteria bacterium]|nr:YihA family ribosome biogenesis GTP-binding protein [Deltaproteobacteria bacterium]MBW2296419.1 YihA family ribosome biogenesis GTP-binding protein [Deltaproteobacteria bacterium]MBW2614056.1 YihA family ribosome biogenesis GTP-binding protein [Deltaproteobacteria bacterium]MBW2634398.1 YihA family ribosome biogenesis GTP-binding protein [Deltaproteobacteria bacterium]MBW2677892.1 YihA family ribosome biogenesis GTP-binding protein [Deltaproteobacteria bacterium]